MLAAKSPKYSHQSGTTTLENILRLYADVLVGDLNENEVSEKRVKRAIWNIERSYAPHEPGLANPVDYNDCASRCAYLHKYAPFHTAIAYKVMHRVMDGYPISYIFPQLTFAQPVPLRICSLGSGPGTDVIGILTALYEGCGYLRSCATLVDIKTGWEETFRFISSAVTSGCYGALQCLETSRFEFVTADLSRVEREVKLAVGSADLVVMMKFVSAASINCDLNIQRMLKDIFKSMKVGAHMLFIDNAGGGYFSAVMEVARESYLKPVLKPWTHEHFVNEWFCRSLFGAESCYSAVLSTAIMSKFPSIE